MSTNTANLGFEKELWQAADKLRGSMDASEYKHVILGLIFLKYISDSFEEKYNELVEEGAGFEEKRDEYLAENIFFVPEKARWDFIAKHANKPEIGQIIDEAMVEIENENNRLKGILPKTFARPELDKRRLGEIVDLFTNMKLGDNQDRKDIIGRTYEYALAMFAEQEGRNAGEFYTPSSIVQTMVEILEPYNGRVYDPACGTGKTVTAVSDAKELGKRTLFLGHTKELISQARETFEDIWQESNPGLYVAEQKDEDAYVLCGSVQSVSQNIEQFDPEEFEYIIIDEAHHGTANTYKKILSYFKPKFTLGLTATPDRTDGEDLLEIFQNVAHKLDLETAVERGVLVPIRCIRVKTNVDISNIRINGIKYNSQDLESKLFVPERNEIILKTYLDFVKNKKTVIFCASVKHAKDIADLFKQSGIKAESVSGSMDNAKRKKVLKDYEYGNVDVLCACDLLNEGWDSPNTQVLFMARPTMSKTLYTQQLGRVMRISKGKDHLMVFDFIDNASLFNMPYSVHRMFNIKTYQPGGYVVAPGNLRKLEKDLIAKGEKPEIYLDYPVDIADYEIIDLFNWQEEVKDMISLISFVRMVDVQSETIEKYIREKKIIPDLEIPMGETRTFKYFKEENVHKYVKEFGWDLITPANMKDMFINFIKIMDMSYSYKPVLLKGIFEHIDENGKVRLEDLVDYFIDYYESRREKGLIVEKKRCLYLRDYTRKEVERNILSNPFKRFEDMNFMKKSRDVEYLEISRYIWRKLSTEEKAWIVSHSEEKLEEYFATV